MTGFTIARHLPARAATRLGVVRWLLAADATWRERNRLKRLGTAAWADMGLDATHAAREAAKPVWDVPQHWSRHR